MARDRAFLSLWLAPMLAPGEQIVADARAFSGPSLSWDLPAVLVTVAGTYSGWRDLGGHAASALLPLAGFLAGACATGISLTRRPYYLVVTQRQLILVRKRSNGTLGPGFACLPLASAVVRTGHSLHRPAVRIASDGGPISVGGRNRASLRLIVNGRRASYESVLDAVRAGGGAVDLPLTPGSAVPVGPA
jgi:hypothetical protein